MLLQLLHIPYRYPSITVEAYRWDCCTHNWHSKGHPEDSLLGVRKTESEACGQRARIMGKGLEHGCEHFAFDDARGEGEDPDVGILWR